MIIRVTVLIAFLWISSSNFAGAEDTLQQLIDRSQENSVIYLENRVYTGNIVIKKPLTIIGSKKSVLRGDGSPDNTITIKAPHVKIVGLQIEHGSLSRNTTEEYAAIKITHANGAILKRLTISDSFHGIYLDYANDNRIEHVKVTGLGGNKIGEQGNGIHLNNSNHNRLFHNRIQETRDGIYFYKSEGNKVSNNNIENTRYGLHYMYSDQNRFWKNRFSMNSGGAAIMVSRHIQLQDNEFSFHQGPRAFGILLLESEDVQITNNRFFHNVRGLYIDNSFNNQISKNYFTLNQVGAEVLSSSNQQTFTDNRFFNNTAPVITDGVRSNNNWSVKGKGNYWGQGFPMLDLDQNGVGDLPVTYKSSLYKLLNEKELAYLFMKSPAIALYEKIGKLTNGQDFMFEDSHPLLEQKSNPSWKWLAAFGLIIGTGCLVIRRRRKLKCSF